MAQEIIAHPPSTNISQVVYDPETQTLTIYFQKGGVCEYYDVDESSARGFEQAIGATSYLRTYIENLFPSQRVG
jgi:hypothetical protein